MVGGEENINYAVEFFEDFIQSGVYTKPEEELF